MKVGDTLLSKTMDFLESNVRALRTTSASAWLYLSSWYQTKYKDLNPKT